MAVIDAAGWAVVHLAWQGVLLGWAWWYATRRAGSADARYVIGLSALALFATMFAVSIGVFLVGIAPPIVDIPARALASPVSRSVQRDLFVLPASAARMAGLLWIIGVAGLALRHVGGWKLARAACIGRAFAARRGLTECARDVAGALDIRSIPQILESHDIDSPAVFGVRHPVVVLPAHGMETLTRAQLRGVIAHELAHVRRRDSIVNLLQCMVDVALFFHPVTHIISRRVRTEREKICDLRAASVCGDAAAYVAGLVALEESRFRSGRFALAARGSHGQLLDRARHVLTRNTRTTSRLDVLLSATCSLFTLLLATALAWPSTAFAGAVRRMPQEFTVSALDPAGRFTITVRRGRAVAGSLDGLAVTPQRIVQQRDSVFVIASDGTTELALRLQPRGGITWTPRPPLHP